MIGGFGTERRLTLGVKLWRVPWLLLLAISAIAATGVAALYSVAGGSFEPWAERHALRFAIGLMLVLALAIIPLRIWHAAALPFYGIALGLLILVPFIGTTQLGARRWLNLGVVSLQPSELMKIAIVLMLARMYERQSLAMRSHWPSLAAAVAIIALPTALIHKQPDLGTAILVSTVGVAMMFLAGVKIRYFVGTGAVLVALGPIVWSLLRDYQKKRIWTYLDPDADPLGAGYHIAQSKIALGSGGLVGKGFLNGTQSQLDFLPEKHTDFIFTMFTEEMGFVGAACLIALYGGVLAILYGMALAARSTFARLLIAGILVTLLLYVSINIGMVSGLVPVVGVPLPLMSYGGTAMFTILVGLGLAISAHVHRDQPLPRD